MKILERRKWSNPEMLIFTIGLRLEALKSNQVQCVMDLLRASLSPKGYKKAVLALEINHFLGELMDAKPILSRYSYQYILFPPVIPLTTCTVNCYYRFSFFGAPAVNEPWGFSFFGHHLCLNIFIMKKQMVISPAFIGAEPSVRTVGGASLCKVTDFFWTDY